LLTPGAKPDRRGTAGVIASLRNMPDYNEHGFCR
jgi:hypothetical protein